MLFPTVCFESPKVTIILWLEDNTSDWNSAERERLSDLRERSGFSSHAKKTGEKVEPIFALTSPGAMAGATGACNVLDLDPPHSSYVAFDVVRTFLSIGFLTSQRLNASILEQPICIHTHTRTGSRTNNAPFYYRRSVQFHNITISHSISHVIWHFRWNVQIKTINYYTHIIPWPTTLKQACLLPGPVCTLYCIYSTNINEAPHCVSGTF